MKKILTILGARPQIIKASAVSSAIADSDKLTELIVHTGQHYDPNMSGDFFTELGLKQPDYQFSINGGSHGFMTGNMLCDIEPVLLQEQPDIVLVYGDTNSTLAGALLASKLGIPIAHVEAGLRSFNMTMPEEVNRILTDRVSNWLFTPTDIAQRHLKAEGFPNQNIHHVGDVMFDASRIHSVNVSCNDRHMRRLGLRPQEYVLVTIHRPSNTDRLDCLREILDALILLSKSIDVVWPVHPRTKKIIQEEGWLDELRISIHIIEPTSYLDMIQLEKYAALIATDSGGVQKEAYFYRVPCVTLREETEWPELVDAGWNKLAPPLSGKPIIDVLLRALDSKGDDVSFYGDGYASQKIVNVLE